MTINIEELINEVERSQYVDTDKYGKIIYDYAIKYKNFYVLDKIVSIDFILEEIRNRSESCINTSIFVKEDKYIYAFDRIRRLVANVKCFDDCFYYFSSDLCIYKLTKDYILELLKMIKEGDEAD